MPPKTTISEAKKSSVNSLGEYSHAEPIELINILSPLPSSYNGSERTIVDGVSALEAP